VSSFTLGDNRELRFVNAESLVLHQLYWFGERGWEPQLLRWWRVDPARARSSATSLPANSWPDDAATAADRCGRACRRTASLAVATFAARQPIRD
jgi:hypothetical protein